MASIRENDFSRIDLNLLTVLLVLHREGSVSRAAERLHLGQPAVSGALSRLRRMFNDPLYVRSAKGMTPTPRAEALIEAITPMMEQMQQILFQPPSFAPHKDVHTFRLGMSDWVESWLMPKLLALIATQAPGVDLQVIATDPFNDGEKVQEDAIDMAISVGETLPAGLLREKIRSMRFTTLWHPQQLALTPPLSLQAFTDHEHLLVSYRGASFSAIDQQLSLKGLQRRVRYVSPHFSALPLILTQMPALATVPDGLAAEWMPFGLVCSDVPVQSPDIPLSLLWHKRRDNDPALQWLLARLRELMVN